MKTILPILLTLIVTSLPSIVAQTVSGTELEIGPSSSNQVTGATSGAIGAGNQVAGNHNLATGRANLFHQDSSQNMALGYGNTLGNWATSCGAFGENNYVNGSMAFVYGTGNQITAAFSAVIGDANELLIDAHEAGVSASLIIGVLNSAEGYINSSLISGYNNVAVPPEWPYSLQSTTTLGEGLINKWNRSTIIGGFNDSSLAVDSGLLFAVGNGANASNRSNAFEVYASGKVVMPRQGDILMGEFGNPE